MKLGSSDVHSMKVEAAVLLPIGVTTAAPTDEKVVMASVLASPVNATVDVATEEKEVAKILTPPAWTVATPDMANVAVAVETAPKLAVATAVVLNLVPARHATADVPADENA